MADLTISAGFRDGIADRLAPRAGLILVGAGLFVGAASMVRGDRVQLLFLLVGTVLSCVGLWLWVLRHRAARRHAAFLAEAARLTDHDPQPVLISGPGRAILFANEAARKDLTAGVAQTLDGILRAHGASCTEQLSDLEKGAMGRGMAQGDVPIPSGRIHLAVHRVAASQLLWRIEIRVDPSLGALDMPSLPMVTRARDGTILDMNPAARKLIGHDIHRLEEVCAPAPVRAGSVCNLDSSAGALECLIVERGAAGGRRDAFLLTCAESRAGMVDGWAFFDHLPVPLLKLDAEGLILLSNRPARALLGREDTAGLRLGALLEGLGRPVTDWIADAAAERGTLHPEFLRVRDAEREIFVQVALNRARDDGDTVLIAVISDATELKSLEAQFVQSQKMQAIGQLAGGIAHDFNNILTAITGHCDLLLLRHDPGDQDYADLTQINQNANRAAALVSQLLAYSRKQTMHPRILDLRDTLSELTHLLNRLVGERIVLSLRHEPDLDAIRADKRQLEQIIMNLVVNSRDAMPHGGQITIVTRNVALDTPLCRDRAVVAPGNYVSVEVIDEGTGIAPDKLTKVFEPFFTTKGVGKGTGLGLSTVYGIVKQSGGFVFVDSVVGQGTTFRLLFPAHPHDAVEPVPSPAPAHGAPRGRGVVLLVEDEVPVRAFARRALHLRGYTVIEAGSAEEALEILSDPTVLIDVFVSDVVMPGLDGPTWVQTALADRPDVPVVFVSGYAEETFAEVHPRIAKSAFLAKPFSLDELVETVHRLVGAPEQAGVEREQVTVRPYASPGRGVIGS